MNEQSLAGQAAFAPANTADIAEALIAQSGLRVDGERRRGRGAGLNPSGRFEPQTPHPSRRTRTSPGPGSGRGTWVSTI